jgi:hypothetical protein
LSNNLLHVASSQKLASSLDTSNFLEDLSKNLLQEVLSTIETPKKSERPQLSLESPFSSPFVVGSAKPNYSSPFALQSTPDPRTSIIKSELQQQNHMEPMVTYSYKEPVQKMTNGKCGPYEKLVNRKRRVRKGKVVHGRKEKVCDWCKTTETPGKKRQQ